MLTQVLAALALGAVFFILMAPTMIALKRWYFGGGKLLRERLGDQPSLSRPGPRSWSCRPPVQEAEVNTTTR
jgi:hypothetical protein